jgi:hypothetical protein
MVGSSLVISRKLSVVFPKVFYINSKLVEVIGYTEG